MNKTLKYFNEIAKIPRCSGNEKNIAKYLCEFAKHKGLEFFADEFDNVIIKKKTSNFSPIIVQAHTDMVCVKSKDSEVNFENQGISLCCKKDYLTAIRDTYSNDLSEIITDDTEIFQELQQYFAENFPSDLQKLQYYEDKTLPLEKLYGFDLEIQRALQKQVWLKSGA